MPNPIWVRPEISVSPSCLVDHRAFTLIELVLVMVIIGIMAAFSVPSVVARMPHVRLKALARQIASELQLSRLRAINDQSAQAAGGDPTGYAIAATASASSAGGSFTVQRGSWDTATFTFTADATQPDFLANTTISLVSGNSDYPEVGISAISLTSPAKPLFLSSGTGEVVNSSTGSMVGTYTLTLREFGAGVPGDSLTITLNSVGSVKITE